MGRTFTFEEAESLVPGLGVHLRQAREAALRANHFEAEMQELSQRIFLSGGMHVDVPAAARRRAEREKAMGEARKALAAIEESGARVGELEEGRLEFAYRMDDREVLLCWTLGDGEKILYWREDEAESPLKSVLDAGFRRERDRLN